MASLNWANWHLLLGLAGIAIGGVILLAMVLGTAAGLMVLMYRVCSGSARIERVKRRRRPGRRRRAAYNGDGEVVPLSALLTHPVLTDDTLDLGEPVDHG